MKIPVIIVEYVFQKKLQFVKAETRKKLIIMFITNIFLSFHTLMNDEFLKTTNNNLHGQQTKIYIYYRKYH